MNGPRSEDVQGEAAAVCMAGVALAVGGGNAENGEASGRLAGAGAEARDAGGNEGSAGQKERARPRKALKEQRQKWVMGTLNMPAPEIGPTSEIRPYVKPQAMRDQEARARAYYSLPSLYP